MAGKKDLIKNFKIDDDLAQYLSHLVMSTNYKLSEIFRQSILIAGPIIEQHPERAKDIGIPDYE